MIAKNIISKIRLPIITSSLVAFSGFSSLADNLEVRNTRGTGQQADIMNLIHDSGALEGEDPGDLNWDTYLVDPQILAIRTNPYNIDLIQDSRPLESQSTYHSELFSVSQNGDSVTSTNRLRFKFIDGQDFNRLYIASIKLNSNFVPNSQEYSTIRNLNETISSGGGVFGYVNLPGVSNVPNNTVYGTLDISCKFTNQPVEIGNKTLSTIDLSKEQVTGVNYTISSQDNPEMGLVQIVNGTNLVVMPNMATNGVNNVGVDLSYIDGSVSNYLGNINYAVASTNQAIVQQPRITGLKLNGPNVDVSLADVIAGAPVTIEINLNVNAGNQWTSQKTETVPFTLDNYGTPVSYTITNVPNTLGKAPIVPQSAIYRARE